MSDTDNATTEPKGRVFDGDFDEDKAKRLIANLDTEIASLRERVTTVTQERDEFKTAAEKTGQEREDALRAALDRAEVAERTLAIQKHGLPEDVVKEFSDYLTGTPEEVDAKAAKLAARLKIEPPKDDANDGGAPEGGSPETDGGDPAPEAPTPPVRPRPRLTPGHGDTEGGKPFDAKAIAAKIRG